MNKYILVTEEGEGINADAESPQDALKAYRSDDDPDNEAPIRLVYELVDVTPENINDTPINDGVLDNEDGSNLADLPVWWNKS